MPTALAEGEALYAFHCAVCHGAGGGGLVEARLAFPEDHRRCTKCHKPNNPVVMPLDRPLIDNDMFAIGDPPALHPLGADAAPSVDAERRPLASVAAPEALFAYVRATMPRYDPARLSDAEYWLITAFLLEMNARPDSVADAVERAVASGWQQPERQDGEGARE